MPPPRKPPAVAQAKEIRIAPPAVRYPHPPGVAQGKQGGVPAPPVRFPPQPKIAQAKPAPAARPPAHGRPPIAQAKAGAAPAPPPRFHELATPPSPRRIPAGRVLQAQLSYVTGYGRESWQGWLARESLLAVFAPLALSPWRDDAARRAWLRIERTYEEISTILAIVRDTPASGGEETAAAAIEEKREAIAASPVPYSRREEVRDRLADLLREAEALRQSQFGRRQREAEAKARSEAEAKAREDNRKNQLAKNLESALEEQRRKEQSEQDKRTAKADRRKEHERIASAAAAHRAEQAAERKNDDGREGKDDAPPPLAAEPAAPPSPPRTWQEIFQEESPALARHEYEGEWQHGASDLGVFRYPDGLEVHIHFKHGSRKIRRAHTRGGIYGNHFIYDSGDAEGTRAQDIGGWKGTALRECTALLPA